MDSGEGFNNVVKTIKKPDAYRSAWTGVALGSNESAGKQRSARTRPGNPALRKALVQAAQAAAHTKNTYLSVLYQRVMGRRGKKRAIMAVAHAIVVAAYHMLRRNEAYRDLGSHSFDERHRESIVNRLVHRLERFGYQVA